MSLSSMHLVEGLHNLIIETSDPRGFIAIDDIRFPIAIGGIRMIIGVNRHETRLLARAMSLKLHSFGFPMSGGKGGIDADNINEFYKFVGKNQVRELINGSGEIQFITGPDIGTSEEEYYEALRRAKLDAQIRPGLLSQPSNLYELPLDNIITAYGVIVACEEILNLQTIRGQDPFHTQSFAIEGFGKVGTGLAKLLHTRAKLIAISTRYGVIIDYEGLDIPKLLSLRSKYGDKLVYEYGSEVFPTNHLFTVKANVLIPGARTEVITKEVAQDIVEAGINVIVPVSNYPYTEEGLTILNDAGVTAFPDFIASAGAVIAAMIEFANAGGEQEAFDLVHAAISYETKDLLLAIKACGDGSKTIYQLALERAEQNRIELYNQQTTDITQISRQIISRYIPSLIK